MDRSVVTTARASQGNSVAAGFPATDATASDGNSLALSCLNTELDSCGLPDKAIAADCAKSEQTFSKMRSGKQAFGIVDFEKLPRDVQVAWMKRYGAAIGVEVRDLDVSALNDRVLKLTIEVGVLARLAGVVIRPRPAKAELPATVDHERRRA